MHTRTFILIISLALLGVSCGNQQTAQQEAFRKMMDVHDVAMEKIVEMNRLARTLKPYRDSLEDQALLDEINLAIERLEGADEAMMQWMATSPKLGKLRDTLDHDQIMAMLEAEQKKIDNIGKAMTSSMENAKAVLARIQEPKKQD